MCATRTFSVADEVASTIYDVLRQHVAARERSGDALRLHLVVAISSAPYRRALLYREPGEGAGREATLEHGGRTFVVAEEAITYVCRALDRRIGLANNVGEKPTSTHRLLEALAREAPPEEQWLPCTVRRQPSASEPAGPTPMFFARTANALQRQRSVLGVCYGARSVEMRDRHGPVYMSTHSAWAQTPEEMSMFDVADACPLLAPEARDYNATACQLVARIVKTLNEHYSLLRGLSLAPDEWLPGGLDEHTPGQDGSPAQDAQANMPSIGALRALRKLRDAYVEARQRQPDEDIMTLWQATFAAQQGRARALARFRSFEEFANSRIGNALIEQRLAFDSIDTNELAAPEPAPDEQLAQEQDVARLLETIGREIERMDALVGAYIEGVLIRQRSLLEEQQHSELPCLMHEQRFRALLAQTPWSASLRGVQLEDELLRRATSEIRARLPELAASEAQR